MKIHLILLCLLYQMVGFSMDSVNDKIKIQSIFAGKNPSTWVFTGNSITQGAKHTHGQRSYPEIFAERIRWEMGRTSDVIINTAISGNTSRNILDGFDQRVTRFQPNVVVLMIGTNDAAIKSNINTDQFESNLIEIVKKIREIDAIPILLTPSLIITDKAPERKDLEKYVIRIRNVAEKNNVILVDNWSIWNHELQEKYHGAVYKELLNDPLHPNGSGHKEIAIAMFKAFSIFDAEAPSCGGEYYEGDHSEKESLRKVVLRLPPENNNPRNSEGDFITLENGKILFIYSHFYGNLGDDWGKARLVGRTSSDNGKTWSKEDAPIVENEGEMNVMSVSLLRLQNGNIALFYARKNSDADCIPMMRISTDEAKSWSKPITCITDKPGYFVINNNRVIQLKTGRLLMPVALHKVPGEKTWHDKGQIFTYYSDDNGVTWHGSAEVSNPQGIVSQEPGVIELKDGTIMMFIRASGGFQQLSYSKDKGQTWSPMVASNIHSPLSPASIARIPSTGDLLMLWNNNDGRNPQLKDKRTPLTFAISKDEGKSWVNITDIETDPNGWYCYIAIHFTKDDVLLSYCAGSQSKLTLLLSETDVSMLRQKDLYQTKNKPQ